MPAYQSLGLPSSLFWNLAFKTRIVQHFHGHVQLNEVCRYADLKQTVCGWPWRPAFKSNPF